MTRKFIAALLLITMLVGLIPSAFAPKTAYAQLGDGGLGDLITIMSPFGGSPDIAFAIANEAADAIAEHPEEFAGAAIGALLAICVYNLFDWEECARKDIFEVLGKSILRAIIVEMTGDIVNWINSGFPEGGPLFVQDFRTSALNAADTASGYFLESLLTPDQLDAVCSPFRIEIILNLFEFRVPRPRCTISDIVENVTEMYQNFLTGGWASFITITANVNNNAFGSFLVRWDQLHAQALSTFEANRDEAQASQGFFAFKECVEYNKGRVGMEPDPNNPFNQIPIYERSEEFGCAKYENKTPGAAIVGMFNANTQAQMNELYLAESINAIISALVGQLIVKPLIEGLSDSPSFEEEQANFQELQARRTTLLADLNPVLARENDYRNEKQTSLNTIQTILTQIETLEACSGQDLQTDTDTYTAQLQIVVADIQRSRTRTQALTVLQSRILTESKLSNMDELEAETATTIASSIGEDALAEAENATTALQAALADYNASITACQAL
ncbi:MAG: hypothetical protein HYT22_00835 [Candidatus Niyogibacteria bacterium]|nr:hypothetical protein [Candidatus Niyogibacteria bacterium]